MPYDGIERSKYEKFSTEEWRRMDDSYVLVIHTATDTVELYDLHYNDSAKEVAGHIKPFEGLPLYHYNKAVESPGKNFKRPFSGVDGPATNQIHFFLNDYTVVDSTGLKFNIQEIQQMDRMRQSRWNTWINLSVIPVTWVMVAGTIQFLLILSWRGE